VTASPEALPARVGRWRLAPNHVGFLGIALGVVGFWLALPPVSTRTPLASVALGICAMAAGIWTASRGERREGWGAILVGALAIGGGTLATYAAVGHLELVVTWSALAAATLRYATPLTLAALGGMFSERSGVVNIGLEGMMLTGAFFGAWAADATGSWVVAIFAAMGAGAALALVHAFFCIHLRADQIVVGTAINFLALGITGYAYIDIYGARGTPSNLNSIPDVHIGFFRHIPPHTVGNFLDQSIGTLNLMIWLTFALLVASYVVLFRTPVGLRVRAVGEHPRAADTVGIPVFLTRYLAVVSSGALAALGGVYLSVGFVGSFSENMTAGRGFIALAALIFGNWRPFGAFGAALLFGFASAVAPRLENVETWAQYGTLFQALPYILTMIAVAGVIGRSIPPAAVGRPYVKQ
jgi:ABC-type uncharacterized transport system permease subunit